MIDIVEVKDGFDLGVFETVVPKAANLLSVQLEALEYAPDFGVDLRYFVASSFQFQNESFKAYLIERLTQNQINVVEVTETLETLFDKYTFNVKDTSENARGFIA